MTSIHHTPGAAHLLAQLQRSQALHNEGVADIEYELSRLRRWQSTRLARTHADVLHNPRYRPAAEFFLDELYGDRDFRQREQDLARVVPIMARVLPEPVLYTTALALELNALSHELDARLTRRLMAEFGFGDELDEATYIAAYRVDGDYEQRRHQIDLVEKLGRDLQRIVPKRFIHTALKMAKGPARLAGVGELHRFLDAGFRAFHHLGAEAGTFVTTITERERAILERIASGHPHPLHLEDAAGYYSDQPSIGR
ncbi:MAG: hypothetical protein IT491_07570 [Gammaproteobacteria bacterium]|nr:hypothetical protein [Gammaproteobacteria bacterium]